MTEQEAKQAGFGPQNQSRALRFNIFALKRS